MNQRRIVRLFYFLVISSLLLSLAGAPALRVEAATVTHFNILLGRPEDNSMTANIIPDQDVELYIEYGISSGSYPAQTASYATTADQPVEIVIGSLSANTRYYYRIVYRVMGETEWSNDDEHSFITQRPPGSSFTFTVTSDNHLGQYGGQTADELDLWEVTLQNIAGDHPDFHIDTGDTFPMDPSPLGTGMTEAEARAAYYYERPYLGEVMHSIPYFFVIGNHENEEGWNFDDVFNSPDQSLARVGMKYRKLYFPNPVPDAFYSGNTDTSYGVIGDDTNQEDYWAWEWGDALFVAIDPFHYSLAWSAEGNSYGGEGQDGEIQGTRWDWSLGIQQYLWFKSVLENSDAKYKFVFAHHVSGGAHVGTTESVYGRGGQSASPYFEWGGQNTDGTWAFDVHRPAADGWTLPIHQLMVENGVDIFFHGHDHDYARELVDGIVYLECPKPDDAGYAWLPYSYGHNEGLYPDAIVELQNSGYFRVSVSPSAATVEYVRSYLPGDGTNGVVADSVTVPGTLPTSYQLMVDKTGPGSGTVTSSLAGIDCGSSCSAAFSTGANLTLTATPAGSSTFTGWSGDCSGSGACVLTMDRAHVVLANFSAPGTTYSLTVNADSNGSVTPSGTSTWNAGEVVNITATPNSGYHFVNWTGNWGMIAHTTGASTTITMHGNYTITANFAANTSTSYTLTTRVAGVGTVTAPSSSTSSHTSGSVVTLTASPGAGYHFVNWTGLINTVANTKMASTTVVMNGSYVIQANFAPNSGEPKNVLTTAVSPSSGGTVSPVPGVHPYDVGEEVSISAVASTGYHFVNWTGDVDTVDDVDADLTTIIMDEDYSITANFALNTYSLTVNAGTGGTITAPPTSPSTRNYGDIVTITANPDTDYHFVNWTGDVSTVNNANSASTTVTIHGDYTIMANFAEDVYYNLSVGNDGHGTVNLSPANGTYLSGTTVTLTPIPSVGYHFSSWSGANAGDIINNGGVYTIVMNGNKSVTANFAINTYTLTTSNDGHGSVTLTPLGGTYDYGMTVTLTPVPDTNYQFLSWSGTNATDIIYSSGVYTIVMNGNKSVKANFISIPIYTLTASSSGNGSVELTPADSTYPVGTIVTLTPVPDANYHFVSWSGANAGDIINTGGVYTIVMNGNKSVTANFAIDTYTLTASSSGHGLVTLVPAGGIYDYGTIITLNPLPSVGYHFVSWSGMNAGDIIDTAGVYTIVMDADKSITANFAINLHYTYLPLTLH